MKTYQDQFTWAYPFDNQFMEHHDGTLSCAITWRGISPENEPTESAQNDLYTDYYQFIQEVARHTGIVVENHFERSADYSLAKQYIEYGENNIVRHHELGMMFRRELAQHLAGYGLKNRVTTVLVLPASKVSSFFGGKRRNKKKLSVQRDKLFSVAKRLMAYLPDSKIQDVEFYMDEINRRANRDYFYSETERAFNPRFYVNQQYIKKPEYVKVQGVNLIKQGKTYTQVCLFIDYPDAKPNWFYNLATKFGVDITVSQTIRPLDTRSVVGQSARESDRAASSAQRAGGEEVAGKTNDMAHYRQYVADNNLQIFANTFVIQFHGQDPELLVEQVTEIEKNLVTDGSLMTTGREQVDMQCWRTSMMGQGYLSNFSRDDHTWQVAHMAPVIKFDEGEKEELQLLRLSAQGTLMGDKYDLEEANHRLTGAQTGSGKTVMQAAEVCELFPLGFNFYINEVGRGFEWVVRLFGGDYFVLDPETTVVSPFPAFTLSFDKDDDQENETLPAHVKLATVNAIMPILMGNSAWEEQEGIVHFRVVAEKVMEACYMDFFIEKFAADIKTPTLQTYLDVLTWLLDDSFFDDGEIQEAADTIRKTLSSFLQTEDGKVFKRADTIDFSNPIIGVDYATLLTNGHKDLAKFMLTFITLRFRQISFSVSNPCFIESDEYHEFVDIDYELMAGLERQCTRRGRKAGAYYNPISQAIFDMVVKSKNSRESNINQYTHKYLMYYGTDFGQEGTESYVPDIFKLSPRATAIWTNYKKVSKSQPYARCLRVNGESFRDYILSYPQLFLDLTDSTPNGIEIKEKTDKMTDDPMEKLALFRKFKDGSKSNIITEEISE